MVHSNQGSRDWLTTTEAAKILGVDKTTVQDYFDKGHLTGVRMPGGMRRVDKDSVYYILSGKKDE